MNSRRFYPSNFIFLSVTALLLVSAAHAKDKTASGWGGTLTLEKRTAILSSYCKALAETYIGWELKKKILGIDPQKMCDDAIEIESTYPNLPVPFGIDQATANLEFYDRFKTLAASFKDAHLSIEWQEKTTLVFELPFKVVQWNKEIVLANIDSQLMSYDEKQFPDLNEDSKSKPEIGDVLLSIDGEKVSEVLNDLKNYIATSNVFTPEKEALQNLFYRDFYFPKSQFTKLTLQSKKKGIYNWKVPNHYSGPGSPDHQEFVQYHNWLNIDSLYQSRTGLEWANTPTEFANLKTLYASSVDYRKKILSHGTWIHKKRKYSYLKIYTFDFDSELRETNEGNKVSSAYHPPISFEKWTDEFFRNLNSSSAPLILDLRHNNGGKEQQSLQFGHSLMPTGMFLQGVKKTYLLNDDFSADAQDLPAAFFYDVSSNLVVKKRFLPSRVYDAIDGASRLFSIDDLFTGHTDMSPRFEGILFIWTDQTCSSVCENLIRLLQRRSRTVIMGQPTAGTGFGLLDLSEIVDGPNKGRMKPLFEDSFYFFKAFIPNFSVETRPDPYDPTTPSLPPELFTAWENNPFQPGISFQSDPTLGPLNAESQWLQKTIEIHEKNFTNSLR